LTGRALKNVLFVNSLVEKDDQEQKKEKLSKHLTILSPEEVNITKMVNLTANSKH